MVESVAAADRQQQGCRPPKGRLRLNEPPPTGAAYNVKTVRTNAAISSAKLSAIVARESLDMPGNARLAAWFKHRAFSFSKRATNENPVRGVDFRTG